MGFIRVMGIVPLGIGLTVLGFSMADAVQRVRLPAAVLPRLRLVHRPGVRPPGGAMVYGRLPMNAEALRKAMDLARQEAPRQSRGPVCQRRPPAIAARTAARSISGGGRRLPAATSSATTAAAGSTSTARADGKNPGSRAGRPGLPEVFASGTVKPRRAMISSAGRKHHPPSTSRSTVPSRRT